MKRLTPILTLILSFLFLPLLHAQNVLTERNIFDLQQVVEAKISPDAKHIAYTVTVPRPFSDPPGGDYRELHLYDVQSGTDRTFISGKKLMHHLGWTGDSRMILFVANLPELTGAQLYGIPVDGGEAQALTGSPTGIAGYTLRPDGGAVAYLAKEAADPAKARLRGMGFNAEVFEEETEDQNVYIRTLPNGVPKRMTEGVSVFAIEWSPDGKYIAAAVAPANTVDNSIMFKRIHLLDPATGTLTKLVDNPGKLGEMSWSPDSRRLAFISAVATWDSREGSIFVAEVPTSKAFDELRNYSKGFAGTVSGIAWRDSQTLLFTADEGVDVTLRQQRLDDAESSILIKGGELAISEFTGAGSLIALAGSTPQHPAELYTFDGSAIEQRTNLNPSLENVRLARQERFVYKADDGLEIMSILVYPLDYEPGKKYPLIVDVHGGPESCYINGWITRYANWGQVAAARGYFVFMPNYRASTGRGVEYTKMGLGDLAGKEFTDVLDGIDALADKGLIDKARVGIGGGSYGGYFSGWAATRHSKRFAASVVFVGVSNQISKRNTTDIPWEDYYVHWGLWTHDDFEKVYDRSPVKWAEGSTTPTLILHGTEDPRVHPSQSLELYRSLKMHGKAPVRLIWYPGEAHGNRKNPARLDFIMRTMDWFDFYLKGDGKGMPPADIDYEIK